MVRIRIFTTSTCPWCVKAKEFFAAHKIPYEEVNVALDKKAAQEMIAKSGQMGVPVIEIDGQIVVGFDRDKITKLLKMRHEH